MPLRGPRELVRADNRLPAGQARARLQAVINKFAEGLRRQVETAGRRGWAKQPYRQLRDFAGLVRDVNRLSVNQVGRLLAETPWDMPPDG